MLSGFADYYGVGVSASLGAIGDGGAIGGVGDEVVGGGEFDGGFVEVGDPVVGCWFGDGAAAGSGGRRRVPLMAA